MTYILTWSNPVKTPITLADATQNTTTSLILTGKGFLGWGQPLQENQLHLLENFASPLSLAPSTFTLGQTWFNSDDSRLNVNVGPSSTTWKELAFRRIDSSTAPGGAVTGDTWFDTTSHYLNIYDSSWKELAYNLQVQGNYSLDSGVINAYVVTLSPAITAYANNFTGSFKVANTNSGASTINAGGGVVALVNSQGGALVGGDLQSGAIVSYLFVQADNRAYVTTKVQSLTDLRYAQLGGLSTQTFEVATAVDPFDAVPLAQATSLASSAMPIGAIIDFAGPFANAPAGYVVCPIAPGGPQLVSTTGLIPGGGGATYANLFAAIGYLWGGSGATFGIPWFPVDYTSSQANGNVGTQTVGQVISHSHNVWAPIAANNPGPYITYYGGSGQYPTPTTSTGGSSNLPASVRVLKCVKAF